ncbi:MAG TPA: gliding motility-associated C-terminal domain-containing protein [Luteibaculaceae bacterium]|nr:gliding motility-associated C-terminal domain-containing protein [Luteibaculaceae bacterium]
MKKIVLGLVVSLIGLIGRSQSFEGKDFWVGYMPNSDNVGLAPTLHFISRVATNATVTVPGTGFTLAVPIPANTMVTRVLPANVVVTASETVTNRGVHVSCPDDITLYTGSYKDYTSDAAIAIPTPNLGTTFDIVSYGFTEVGQSEFILVGTENGTNIRITYRGWTTGGKRTGNTETITLNRGETFLVQAYSPTPIPPPADPNYKDLTGTKVEVLNNKKIAVYTGNECVYAGGCPFCDHMYEQMRDPSTWGDVHYLVNTSKGSATADIMRVFSNTAGTTYTINGVPQPALNAGQWRDHDLAVGTVIISNNKVHVSQILRGSSCSAPPLAIDPLLLDILPVAQYGSDYLFGTSNYVRYTVHYATVIMETAQIATLQLNGTPVATTGWTAITGTTYSTKYLNLAGNRTYNLLSTNGSKFGLFVYGYGTEESYGYTAGGNLFKLDGCPIAQFSADSVCDGSPVVFNNTSFDPKFAIVNHSWDFAGQGTSSSATPSFTFSGPGTYAVKLKVTNNNPTAACADSVVRNVVVLPNPVADAGADQIICSNDSASIGGNPTASGGNAPYLYQWTPAVGLSSSSAANPKAKPSTLTTFEVRVEDKFGCVDLDQVDVSIKSPDSLFIAGNTTICKGGSAVLTFNLSANATGTYQATVSNGTGSFVVNNITQGTTYTVNPTVTTTYTITSFTDPVNPNSCLYYSTTPATVVVRDLPTARFSINNATICEGQTQAVNVVLTGAGPKNFSIIDSGAGLGEMNFSPLVKAYSLNPLDTKTYTLALVEYSNMPKCTQFPNERLVINVNRKRDPGADSTAAICFNDPTFALFPFIKGNPESGGTWTDVNNAGISIGSDQGTSVNPSLITPGNYTFRYTLTGNAPCADTSSSVIVQLKDAPKLTNITSTCASDLKSYVVSGQILGGLPSSYQTQAENSITSSGGQYTLTSDSFPSKTNFTIEVWDGFNCDTAQATGFVNCGCLTRAGTMQQNAIEICRDATATAIHNGDQVLVSSRNDVLRYYLHEGSARVLVNPIDSATSPSFAFKPGMVIGRTYYISAVAGPQLNGFINFLDPDSCVSIAQGTPVRFFDFPAGSVTGPSQICLNSGLQVVSNLSGAAPFTIDIRANGTTQTFSGQNVQNTHTFTGINATDTVSLLRISDRYCTLTQPGSSFVVSVRDFPRMQAGTEFTTCDAIAENYTWSFNVVGGDPASYSYNPSVGTLQSGLFTSNPIPTGDTVFIQITDAFNCGSLNKGVSVNCPCITSAGTIANQTFDVCITNAAVMPLVNGAVLDPNDRGMYVLSTSATNPLSAVIWSDTTPVVMYDVSTMSVNVPYYFFYLAGNGLNNAIDLSDRCLSITASAVLRWRNLPVVNTFSASPNLICAGSPSVLTLQLSGNGPFTYFGSTNGVLTTNSNVPAGTSTQTMNPTVNTLYTLDSVVDVFGCKWQSSRSTLVNINPTPAFQLSGDAVVCDGSPVAIKLKITQGIKPYRFTLTDGAGFSASYNSYQIDSLIEVVVPPTAGNYTYRLSQFSDSLCPASNFNSTVNVVVNANPTGYFLSGPTAICDGSPLSIQFNSPNSNTHLVDLGANGSSLGTRTLVNGAQITDFPYSVGTNVFDITKIVDVQTGCSSNLGTNIQVQVRALPVATLCCGGNGCVGDSLPFEINTIGTPNFLVTLASGMGSFTVNQTGSSILKVLPSGGTGTYPLSLASITDPFGCTTLYNNTQITQVEVHPAPSTQFDVVNLNSDQCIPLKVEVIDRTVSSLPHRSELSIDNGPSQQIASNYTHIFTNKGKHTLKLITSNVYGCSSSLEKFIDAYPVPEADFQFGDANPTVLDPQVRAVNRSFTEEGSTFNWRIEPLGWGYQTEDVLAMLPGEDEGLYTFYLSVISPFGCKDSTQQRIKVDGVTTVYLPNSFTPNGDGTNDVFKVIHFAADIADQKFELAIYDRWGACMFRTQNINDAWDGTFNGNKVPNGVYNYRLSIKSKYNADRKERFGTINVLY